MRRFLVLLFLAGCHERREPSAPVVAAAPHVEEMPTKPPRPDADFCPIFWTQAAREDRGVDLVVFDDDQRAIIGIRVRGEHVVFEQDAPAPDCLEGDDLDAGDSIFRLVERVSRRRHEAWELGSPRTRIVHERMQTVFVETKAADRGAPYRFPRNAIPESLYVDAGAHAKAATDDVTATLTALALPTRKTLHACAPKKKN